MFCTREARTTGILFLALRKPAKGAVKLVRSERHENEGIIYRNDRMVGLLVQPQNGLCETVVCALPLAHRWYNYRDTLLAEVCVYIRAPYIADTKTRRVEVSCTMLIPSYERVAARPSRERWLFLSKGAEID